MAIHTPLPMVLSAHLRSASVQKASLLLGTSEVEHVLATQTLLHTKSKNLKICIEGELGNGVTGKDVVLHTIGVLGTAGTNRFNYRYNLEIT